MIIIGLDGIKFRNFERIMKNCIFVITFLLSRKGTALAMIKYQCRVNVLGHRQ